MQIITRFYENASEKAYKYLRFMGVVLALVLAIGLQRPVNAEAATSTIKYVSDSSSPLSGKNVKLFYDSNGNLIQDTESLVGYRSKYEIFVNKSTNVVTIYTVDNGVYVPIKRFVCSNGGSNTPEGNFYTPNKYRWHTLMGPCYGQWDTRINGGVLFHSVYYNQYNDNNTLNVNAYNKLGTTCSHGCVRLRAGDAKWIYDNCALGTRVYIYSKSGYEPFTKPTADKLASWHTWDPTDPNMQYKCKERGCHAIGIQNGTFYDATTGQWKLYKDGVFATWVNGIVNTGNYWELVRNGIVDTGAYGVYKNENGWWYVRGGRVDFSANTIAKNENGWWIIRGGKVDFSANTIAKNENGWWLVRGGKVDFSANTVAKNENGWWLVRGGKVDFSANTVAQNENGWWCIRGGKVDFNYNGIASNDKGTWVIRGGKVDFNSNGIVQVGNDKYYASAGKIQTQFNGLTDIAGVTYFVEKGKINTNNTVVKAGTEWIYITSGKPDYSFTGLAKNGNGWWLVKSGKVDFSYSGLVKDAKGRVWLATNGKVDTSLAGDKSLNCMLFDIASGEENSVEGNYFFTNGYFYNEGADIVKYNETWWYVEAGQRNLEITTVAKNGNGWWYVKDGKVDFSYNGVAENNNGIWCIVNGKVDFSLSGFVKVGTAWYNTSNGRVITGEPTVVKNKNGWWYVNQDGKNDFGYTGLASNENGTWLVEGGQVKFTFNGEYEEDGITYTIQNSKVVGKIEN